MRSFGLSFHHFGLALREREGAEVFLRGLGYDLTDLIYDPEQDAWLRMCSVPGMPSVELVLAVGDRGPLQTLLKRQETAIYHTCYFGSDIAASLGAMEASGLSVLEISAPKPAILFSGAAVSFHYVAGFGLIELLHAANPVILMRCEGSESARHA